MLRYWRKLLARHRKRLEQDIAHHLDTLLNALSQALASEQQQVVDHTLAEAELAFNKHLAFAQKSAAREYTESIILAVLFALLLRAFVVEAFKIPTRSMVPTLLEGDHLFVNKFAYGIRMPLTTTRLIDFAPPERGDVIVFVFPKASARAHLQKRREQHPFEAECLDNRSLSEDKDYIKRVVGLPGDTLQMINHEVYINNHPIDHTELYHRSVPSGDDNLEPYIEVWIEEQLGDHRYATVLRSNSANKTFGPITVEEGHIFVMGDNRDNSSDSRCWGQVPIENIKGQALMIWWSSGKLGARWSRLFTLIE